ncbi:MAG: hydrogenase maturation nickel metallochaperone HypA [Deinococcales bacterium]
MHELSIARSVVDLAVQAATDDQAERITRVGLRVGTFAGVDTGALDSAFAIARLGTLAEEAELEIDSVALVCHCAACDIDFEVDDRYGIARCPRCATVSGVIRHGMELEVSFVEVV